MIATPTTFNDVFELDGPSHLDGSTDVWGAESNITKVRRNPRKRKSTNTLRSSFCLDHLPGEFLQPLDLLQLSDDAFLSGFSHANEHDTTGGGALMWLAAAGALSVVVPAMTGGAFPTSRMGPDENFVISGFTHDAQVMPGHIFGPAQIISHAPSQTEDVLYAHIAPRIAELEEIAADEDIAISAESKANLISLFVQFRFKQAPSLFLLDNGNFKVAWRESLERHVSFELLGNGVIKPVIFSKDDQTGSSNHLSGVISVRRLPELLAASGLKSWILKD